MELLALKGMGCFGLGCFLLLLAFAIALFIRLSPQVSCFAVLLASGSACLAFVGGIYLVMASLNLV